MRAYVLTYKGSQRWPRARTHLTEQGLEPIEFRGINAPVAGLNVTIPSAFSTPENQRFIESRHVGCTLGHWNLWRALEHLPDSEFLIVEDDVLFLDGWEDTYREARQELPSDWDVLFVGSCNCEDKDKVQVGKHVWEVKWPFCTHAYLVKRASLRKLSISQEKLNDQIDQSLWAQTFATGKAKAYTILPRLAEQESLYTHP